MSGTQAQTTKAEIERRAVEIAAQRFTFMGLDPSDLVDAIYFAKARGWTAPSARSTADSDEGVA